MKIFGFDISVRKAASKQGNRITGNTGLFGAIQESFPGAWQRGNIQTDVNEVLGYSAVHACINLISNDISKLKPIVRKRTADDIWLPDRNIAIESLLKKPNRYQTRIQFFKAWVMSREVHGNTYVLKARNKNGRIVALYILDPKKVTPLITDEGGIYYELAVDNLTGTEKTVTAPASEIIHDRTLCLYHPLIGVAPLKVASLSAALGRKIQTNSYWYFEHMSRPSGVIHAPGEITTEDAKRLKEEFNKNYSGENIGKIPVLGDGLKYDPISFTATDSQLIEQLKWTAEDVCRCFGVPGYKLGVGNPPSSNSMAALNQQYFSESLQPILESIEMSLTEGLGLGDDYIIKFDEMGILRMDMLTRYQAYYYGINGGWMKPDEPRGWENLAPVKGGDTPYMQQQNWSLAQLATRSFEDNKSSQSPNQEEKAFDINDVFKKLTIDFKTKVKQLGVK